MNRVWKNILSITVGLGMVSSLTFSFATLDQANPLKENDRQVAVFELQRALKELGYLKSNDLSNTYGSQTVAAVKAFQSSLKMSSDGVSGKVTLEAIRDHQRLLRIKEELKVGSKGLRVTQLKSDLKELGYLKTASGDSFDASTEKALMAFQKSRGLKADGKAGDTTLESVTKALAEKRNYTTAVAAKPTTSKAQASTQTAKKPEAPKAVTAPKTAAPKTAAPAKPEAAKPAKAKSSDSAANFSRGAEAVRKSKTYLGVSYVYGGASSKGFDCSGFTMYVMKSMGVSLPHGATAQFGYGDPVDKANLKEGDLLFFKTTPAPIGHVGIYIGNGQFIHASSAKTGVIISNLKTYGGKYVGARRIL